MHSSPIHSTACQMMLLIFDWVCLFARGLNQTEGIIRYRVPWVQGRFVENRAKACRWFSISMGISA
jgi:hypothetical protein